MIIRKLAIELDLYSFTIWKIPRENLHMYPPKPKTVGHIPDLRTQDDKVGVLLVVV